MQGTQFYAAVIILSIFCSNVKTSIITFIYTYKMRCSIFPQLASVCQFLFRKWKKRVEHTQTRLISHDLDGAFPRCDKETAICLIAAHIIHNPGSRR